jgi:hypothetical protein
MKSLVLASTKSLLAVGQLLLVTAVVGTPSAWAAPWANQKTWIWEES